MMKAFVSLGFESNMRLNASSCGIWRTGLESSGTEGNLVYEYLGLALQQMEASRVSDLRMIT